MVIYTHSFAITTNPKNTTEVIIFLTKAIDSGSLAVLGFFILSGFLTTQSMLHSKNYLDYLKKRLLRIVPAFLVCLVCISLLLGPLFTKMNIVEYLTSSSTWKFIWYNITFNVGEKYIGTPGDLFKDAPYPGNGDAAANGSMWTLHIEFGCYILMIVLSFFFMLRHRFMMIAFTVVIGILYFMNMKYKYMPFNLPVKQFWVLGYFELPHFLKFGFYYCMGSLMYLYRDKILYSHRFLLLAVLLLGISVYMHKFNEWLMILLPYIVISVGINFSFKPFRKLGDPSYGLYIYAWPIQTVIVVLTDNKISVYGLFFTATLATLVVSMISWRYIEKPMLTFKKPKSIPPLPVNKKFIKGNKRVPAS